MLRGLSKNTSLRILFQCLNTYLVKKCFLMSSRSLSWHSSAPFPHIGSLGARDKRSGHHYFPFSGSCKRSPLSLLSSNPASLEPSATAHRICLPVLSTALFSLDTFEDLHILLPLWSPKLCPALEGRLHQHWILWYHPPFWVAHTTEGQGAKCPQLSRRVLEHHHLLYMNSLRGVQDWRNQKNNQFSRSIYAPSN